MESLHIVIEFSSHGGKHDKFFPLGLESGQEDVLASSGVECFAIENGLLGEDSSEVASGGVYLEFFADFIMRATKQGHLEPLSLEVEAGEEDILATFCGLAEAPGLDFPGAVSTHVEFGL